jgi:hypothetical protein
MKYTKFLEENKKSTARNSAGLPTPKLYRKPNENQVYWIAYFIFSTILLVSLLINFIFINPPKATCNVIENEVVEDSGQELPNLPPTTNGELTPGYKTMPICSTTATFKSWMDYRKITNTSTRQWRYQQIATTDEYGFRKVGDYYMVAMAKQYGPVGTKYIITFSGGQQMPVIIGDLKANTQCAHPDGSMIEMIVDSQKMPGNVKRSGNYNSMIIGTITEIRVEMEDQQ